MKELNEVIQDKENHIKQLKENSRIAKLSLLEEQLIAKEKDIFLLRESSKCVEKEFNW